MKTAFEGEVQFAGYTDSSRNGPRVTLRLADRDELQRFVGLEGKRFMVALVEIAEDGTPVSGGPASAETQDEANLRMRKTLDAMPLADKPKGGPLARLAGQWCAMPSFHAWLLRTMPDLCRVAIEAMDNPGELTPKPDSDIAAEVVRRVCNVASRADIDHNAWARDRFEALIRRPFMEELQRAHQER